MRNYSQLSLDEWYKTINSIFIDRNFERSEATIFAHIVEIVGGLSCLSSNKHRPGVAPESYLPKAFAWWMALCGKMRVRSVEGMIWAKFPGVCPYCQMKPHKDATCRAYKRDHSHPNWEQLKVIATKTFDERPRSLSAWQIMFSDIYPSSQTEEWGSIFGRVNEEVGELSEAVRAFDLAPGLFFSEAPDVFAWLMKVANKLDTDRSVADEKRGAQISEHFARAYPDKCEACDCSICRCPAILPSTMGRIAKEIPTTIDFREHHGPILSMLEIKALFEKGVDELHYNKEVVKVDAKMIQQINVAIGQLLNLTDQSNKRIIECSADLVDAILSIKDLAATQRVSNEGMEKLAKALAGLPSEPRSVALNFLTNVAAAPWSALLIEMVNNLSR